MSKKIGLALGGGGAKGFAHIGVLRALEELEIKIDIVSGTSIGAVIGALHCSGLNSFEIELLIKQSPWKKFIDFNFPKKGFVKGDKFENYLRYILDSKTFSDLKKPFFVTSTDILNSQEVIFNKGDLVKAVRASISIPGIFNPVGLNNRVLVDGGVLDNLPFKLLKENGAKKIIAVNLKKGEIKEKVYESASLNSKITKINIPSIISSLLASYSLVDSERIKNLVNDSDLDLLITPELKDINIQDFHKIDIAIQRGYWETIKNSDFIKHKFKEGIFKKGFRKILRKN